MNRLVINIFLFFFLSCTPETIETEMKKVVLSHYEDQSPRDVWVMIKNDSTEKIFRYYRTGELNGVMEAQDSIANGKAIFFYPTGDTASKLNFKHGQLDGIQKWYKDGCLIEAGYYTNGVPTGEEILYGFNETMYSYNVYADNGVRLYHAAFDEMGEVVLDSGSYILWYSFSHNDSIIGNADTLFVGDTIEIHLSVIRQDIPNLHSELSLVIKDSSAHAKGNEIKEPIEIGSKYLNANHKYIIHKNINLSLEYVSINTKTNRKKIIISEAIFLLVSNKKK